MWRPGEASPEEDESFELVRWPVAEVRDRLGEIEDAKTLAGLLLYLHDTSRPDPSAYGRSRRSRPPPHCERSGEIVTGV